MVPLTDDLWEDLSISLSLGPTFLMGFISLVNLWLIQLRTIGRLLWNWWDISRVLLDRACSFLLLALFNYRHSVILIGQLVLLPENLFLVFSYSLAPFWYLGSARNNQLWVGLLRRQNTEAWLMPTVRSNGWLLCLVISSLPLLLLWFCFVITSELCTLLLI